MENTHPLSYYSLRTYYGKKTTERHCHERPHPIMAIWDSIYIITSSPFNEWTIIEGY